MRGIAFSDIHLDWRTSGYPRFEDVSSALDALCLDAISRKVDVVFFLGDATDPDSGPVVFRCIAKLLEVQKRLAGFGIRTVWLSGNHDVIEDGRGGTTLSPLEEICERPNHVLIEHPMVRVIGDATVLALPYPPHVIGAYDPVDWIGEHRAEIEQHVAFSKKLLVVGHLSLKGIHPGEEETEMPRGRNVFYPAEEIRDLAEGAELLMLDGHIHRAQTYDGVQVVGSLVRLTHGEEEHEPGYLRFEI